MSKMNSLTISNSLPTTTNDGWATVPAESSNIIRGKMIRFVDGNYIINKTEPGNGKTLVVLDVVVAWTRWSDGKPTHHITQPGEQHPLRVEMPDLDPSLWKPGIDGKPADPWKDTRYVHLVDQFTAEAFTFVTDTAGGRKAVSELADQIKIFRSVHPGAMPVVTLRSEKWRTQYGFKPKPLFKVVGWKQAGGE